MNTKCMAACVPGPNSFCEAGIPEREIYTRLRVSVHVRDRVRVRVRVNARDSAVRVILYVGFSQRDIFALFMTMGWKSGKWDNERTS